MYIVILEGEAPKIATKISEGDFSAADEGVIEEIIDLDNSTHYVDGEWRKMLNWNENGEYAEAAND